MTDSEDRPTPPDGLPENLATELNQLTPEELRNLIIYAEEVLQFHGKTGPPVEPGPGEDILRATEHDGYTEVIKEVECAEGCADCPHGPYLYHVTEEPRPEGDTHYHWSFIGTVDEGEFDS